MAKSPTEQIRDLALEVRGLLERDSARAADMTRMLAKVDRLEDRVAELEQENAALKQQLNDHLAQYQEGDRRRWTLFMALIGAVLALASGLIVTLVKK